MGIRPPSRGREARITYLFGIKFELVTGGREGTLDIVEAQGVQDYPLTRATLSHLYKYL